MRIENGIILIHLLVNILESGKGRKMIKVKAADEFGVDPKSGMWQLPRYVGKYAEQDALITLNFGII
jgi:hypothetical protein